jgi:hypothetical protein
VGEKTFITTDGGDNWIQKSEFDTKIFQDVYFKNEKIGWLLGDSLYFTTDGGNSWKVLINVHVSVDGEFEWVDEEVGYITGGTFYETTNGGNTWQDMLRPGQYFPRFSAPLKGLGYGVGIHGLIMKFDNRITSEKEDSVLNLIEYSHFQNYPNPFNSATIIKFTLNMPGTVNMIVYDILGREVVVLIDDALDSGEHSLTWTGKSKFGNLVSSGVYICRLIINYRKEVNILERKICLIK